MKYFKILIIYSLITTSINSYANLIDINNFYNSEVTNLDWLMLTETQNMSYNEVTYKIETGELKGWRYATGYEFENLLTSLGGRPRATCTTEINYCGPNPASRSAIISMLDKIGITNPSQFSVDQESLGLISDTNSSGLYHHVAQLSYNSYSGYAWTHLGIQKLKSEKQSTIGSFIVKETSVPEPSTLSILILALVSLSLMKHTKVTK